MTSDKIMTAKAGTPKHDGSGKGKRANQGRGGCPPSKQPKTGKGRGQGRGK